MRKFVCSVLTLCLLLCLSICAMAEEATEPVETTAPTETPADPTIGGECGGLFWSFDPETGSLTVSGEGPMEDFENEGAMPWAEYLYDTRAIVIEPGVTHIGQYAFRSARAETLSLPEGLESIGCAAFENCSGLTGLALPQSLYRLDRLAFSGCRSISGTLDLSGVTELEADAFSSCDALEEVILSGALTQIPERLFYGCGTLARVDIPEGVTVIGPDAFYRTAISSIELPGGLKEIGSGAFADCQNLTELLLPEGLTVIGNKAFQSCLGLTSITVPDSVTDLGENTFESCENLISARLPAGYTGALDGTFMRCRRLTDVTIPEGVTEIGECAFYECYALEAIQIPGKVERIGRLAFQECTGLTAIRLPDSLTRIDEGAFRGCTGLTELVIPKNVIRLGQCFAEDCSALETVKVLNPDCEFTYGGHYISQELGIPFTTLICGYEGSTAQSYAKECELPFRPLTGSETSGQLYSDVRPSDWFYDEVEYVTLWHMMSGTGGGKFSPHDPTTRGMVVTIIYRYMDEPSYFGENPFSDVRMGKYYYDPVCWAYEEGIVSGMDDTHFAPDATVTREQLVTILYRFFLRVNDCTERAELSRFPDADRISAYARDAMSWAVARGILSGTPKNGSLYLNPRGTATRAEVAAIFMRYREILKAN